MVNGPPYAKEEDFEVWFERLEQWFFANSVPDYKQITVLLSLLKSEIYALLRLATPPKPPPTVNFKKDSRIPN